MTASRVRLLTSRTCRLRPTAAGLHSIETPHGDCLHAEARVIQQLRADSDLQLAYAGIDGPLLVRFNDGSRLMAHPQSGEAPGEPPLSRWSAGIRAGLLQRCLEAIVRLAHLAELVDQVESDDRSVIDSQPLAQALSQRERSGRRLPPSPAAGSELHTSLSQPSQLTR